MIYFDSAATTFQKPLSVRKAVWTAMETMSSPSRGDYGPARRAAETAFQCRQEAAALFHMEDAERVVITSSATHGLNIAIRSLVVPGDHIVISGYEHNAVTRPLFSIDNVEVTVAGAPLFDQQAVIDAFDDAVTEKTDAVICNHVSNVFGFVQPVETIAEICRARHVPLIIDASQSAGILDVDFGNCQPAFVAMPGHKGLYGPQGTGLLLCAGEAAPLLYGGTGSNSLQQEMPAFLPDRLEAGTHNMPGIAGLLAGIRFVKQKGITRIEEHEKKLAERFARNVRKIPGVRVYADPAFAAQSGVVSITAENMDCESIAESLANKEIAVRAGFHCAPSAHKTGGTISSGTVRFSFSCFNTFDEVDRACQILTNILREEKHFPQ